MKTLMITAAIVAGVSFGAPAMAQTKPVISVIVKDTTSPYWQAVLAGARQAGQEMGATIVELGAQSETDAIGQIGVLDSAVAANPAAILIAPAQSAALAKPIAEAAKKVTIIGLESGAETTSMTAIVGTDNAKAGRIAAGALATAIKRSYADAEGDVVVITAIPGVAALDQRAKGFRDEIAANFRAIDIASERVGDGQPATASGLMRDAIAHTADLRGVFTPDPLSTEAVAEAVMEKKSGDKINVIGVGVDEKLVTLLQDGVIAGLVVEDPFRMGYDGVKTALAASKGETVAAHVDTGATLVTKANLSSARSQELLKPIVKY
jgi:ribose transport system substrate-binding protein